MVETWYPTITRENQSRNVQRIETFFGGKKKSAYTGMWSGPHVHLEMFLLTSVSLVSSLLISLLWHFFLTSHDLDLSSLFHFPSSFLETVLFSWILGLSFFWAFSFFWGLFLLTSLDLDILVSWFVVKMSCNKLRDMELCDSGLLWTLLVCFDCEYMQHRSFFPKLPLINPCDFMNDHSLFMGK